MPVLCLSGYLAMVLIRCFTKFNKTAKENNNE